MATAPTQGSGPGAYGSGFNVRGIALNLLVDAALPFITYQILTGRGTDTIHALIISGIFPAVWSIGGLVRARRVDIIGGLVLLGIAVSIVAALIGGNAKLLLIRESFVTGALGIVALVSLLAPRPLMFYFGRQMATGMDPARIASFDAAWRFSWFRRLFLLLTLVWGVGWTGEFALRVLLVSILTVPQALAITPVLFNLITVALIAWTFAYSRRVRASHIGNPPSAANTAADGRGAVPAGVGDENHPATAERMSAAVHPAAANITQPTKTQCTAVDSPRRRSVSARRRGAQRLR